MRVYGRLIPPVAVLGLFVTSGCVDGRGIPIEEPEGLQGEGPDPMVGDWDLDRWRWGDQVLYFPLRYDYDDIGYVFVYTGRAHFEEDGESALVFTYSVYYRGETWEGSTHTYPLHTTVIERGVWDVETTIGSALQLRCTAGTDTLRCEGEDVEAMFSRAE